MTKEYWVNLPVKNVGKTTEFFKKIGFSFNEEKSNETMACFEFGEKKQTILFFAEDVLKTFVPKAISDAKSASEVIISFDAESPDEIDEMARRVFDAGGTIYAEPAELHGWMYNVAFADLDGHCWNMLYMDFSKMPHN